MIKREKLINAIFSVFPNTETFLAFKRDFENQSIINSFIELSVTHNLIAEKSEDAFINLISENAPPSPKKAPPEDLNFETLLKEKKDLLNITLSERALAERINALIKNNNIALPKLSNTMLTRLKREPADTPHKRNSLRSLAFWLGYERADLNTNWSYPTLFKLCRTVSLTPKIDKGVRIGLSLYSRGDVIGQEVLAWLKKNIKDFIRSSLTSIPAGGWGKVRSYDITTAYVDFPKQGDADFPASYQTSIRKALSVAHQIAVRWALSEHCTKNRFLSIGIATGEFTNLNNYLLPMLTAKLPGDPVIRMSDFTHQCILVGDIRTVFCRQPEEVTLFNGETLSIWWVLGLWTFIYWDFIPGLLEDEIMQPTPKSIERLNRFFLYPEKHETGAGSNAIKRFFMFPQNPLLGIEVAKTLYYRRCFGEANEILRLVLSIDPTNVSARSLRMMIYRNLAIAEADEAISRIHFSRAENEARFILRHCDTLEEDFFCEYAVISLSKAVNTLRQMRKNNDTGLSYENFEKQKNSVFHSLERANRLFEKGIVVSPTGNRSIYLMICTQILTTILKEHDHFFKSPAIPISVPKTVYRKKAFEILSSFNFFGWEKSENTDYALLERILLQSFERHGSSSTLRAYQPTLNFCFAVMLWDVFPERSVNSVVTALNFLKSAISLAKELEEQNLFIYSYTRCLGEMLEPAIFIRHIEQAVQRMEKCAGTLEELETLEPSRMIGNGKDNFTLFTLNI